MNDSPPSPSCPPPPKRSRPKRLRAARLPELSVEQILRWADEFFERYGRWPKETDGRVEGALTERWKALDLALRQGYRSLPGGSSLPRLLADQRGVRNIRDLPPFRIEQILQWVDLHHARTGKWPKKDDGSIDDAPGETWSQVDSALVGGSRGLPGGSSLPRLLADQRGVRNHLQLPVLSTEQILVWAEAHHRRTGKWPKVRDGPIHDAPGETWVAVDSALRDGMRGLAGGSSLPMLLNEHCGVRNRKRLPRYSIDQILHWADLHHARTGKWPQKKGGPILEAPGETWAAVDAALYDGIRGLPGRSSLIMVLSEHRGVRDRKRLPPFSIAQILTWADDYYASTGDLPNRASGPIAAAPGETWMAVESALINGRRGLPGGSSLHRLLVAEGRKNSPSTDSRS